MSKIRGNDDNFNNYTSTEEQMSRSRTSSSSMDTLSPPGSLSSSPESHQKTFSSRSSEDNVFTPDRLPFSLDQVRRSPRLIVENKLRKQSSLTPSRSGDQVQQTEKSITTKDEDMIKMRLFYLGIIKDLADVNKKADTTAIKQHAKKDFKSLKRRKSDIIFEVDKVRGLIFQSEQRIAALTRHLDSIVLEINCLQSLSKEEEDRTLETLKSYYLDMSKSLDGLKFEDQSSLLKTSTSKGKGSYGSPGVFTKHFNFSSGSSSTFSPPAALSSTVSFTPPPLTPGSSFSPPNRELSFSSTLLALAGQLTELCQGEHGSKLVIKRIREGSCAERDLVWTELRLPASIVSILLQNSDRTLAVVQALTQSSLAMRKELAEHVDKVRSNIESIKGGPAFLKKFSASSFAKF